MAFHSTDSDLQVLRRRDSEIPAHPKGLRKIAVCDWGMREIGYFHGFFQVQDYYGKPTVGAMIEWPDGTAEIIDKADRELIFLDSLASPAAEKEK